VTSSAYGTLIDTVEVTNRQKPKDRRLDVCLWPASAAFFGTGGLVKVKAEIGGYPFRSAFMPLGDGNHKLPVKADILRAIACDTARLRGVRPHSPLGILSFHTLRN
jgi:hypothetical protein